METVLLLPVLVAIGIIGFVIMDKVGTFMDEEQNRQKNDLESSDKETTETAFKNLTGED